MRGVRVLVTIRKENLDKIDDRVKNLNKDRQWFNRVANRQTVIKAFVRHCLEQENLVLKGYGKHARVEPAEK